MKVLHINSYYSTCKFYKNLYDRQKESGLDIEVYVPVPTNFDTTGLNLGEYTRVRKNHGKYDRIIFHLKHRKIYNDIIKTYDINDFTLLHAHSLFSNGYIAYKLKENFNVPYIVAVRDTDVNLFYKYIIYLRKLGVKILKEADKVIFLSKPYRNFLIDKYIPDTLKKKIFNKSETIPNGIDDFWLQNKGIPKKINNQKKLKILTVGVISKRKNQITATKAIKKLQDNGYKIKYTVVGKVKDEKIFKQIKDLSYIKYIPHTSKEKLINIYRDNDIFVLPSRTETFGLVYPEAMSQGLPVIYTRGQGFDGQFREGKVGYSVDSNDVEEIADKIINVVKDYNEISKRCIKLADNFAWDRINEVYSVVYENVL